MSTFVKTAILAVCGLAVGIYLYFVEIRGREEAERRADDALFLVAKDFGTVTQLSLSFNGEQSILQKDSLGEWMLVSPVNFTANQGQVLRIVSEIRDLEKAEDLGMVEAGDVGGDGQAGRVMAANAKRPDGIIECAPLSRIIEPCLPLPIVRLDRFSG